MEPIRCTQCGSDELETGFMADLGQGARGVAKWIIGPLQKGLFGTARTVGRARLDVYALRCPNCSHLELFAR